MWGHKGHEQWDRVEYFWRQVVLSKNKQYYDYLVCIDTHLRVFPWLGDMNK